MSNELMQIFSEYEVRQMNFALGERLWPVECIGSAEESNEVRKVVKKCRGVVSKTRTIGTGNGTVKVTAHMPYELYAIMHAMNEDDTLIDGVYGYGTYSHHPEMLMTEEILDEDGLEKFRAYPRCIATTGPARKTTNGEEEVAEVDLEISFMPDATGMGFYEALKDDIDKDVAEKWMSEFTPALVRKSADVVPEV